MPNPLPDPEPEDARLRRLIQGLLESGFDPDHSPYLEEVAAMTATQFQVWERQCRRWDGQSRLYESYRANLAQRYPPHRSPLHAQPVGQAAISTQRRKVNKALPIEKFTTKLALEQPFFIWYQTFHRELLRERADSDYQLDMLYYYVDRRCFQPWSQTYSARKMNDFNFIVNQLDKHYPDPTTPSERREQSRSFKMRKSGVLEYSNEKERLWRLAYPTVDPLKSEEFKDSWMEGLPRTIKMWIVQRRMLESTPIPQLVSETVQYERDLLRVDKSGYSASFSDSRTSRPAKPSKARPDAAPESKEKKYDRPNPKSKPNSRTEPSTKHCWEFAKFGSCDKGPDCPYLHIAPSDRTGKPSGKDNETKKFSDHARSAKIHRVSHKDIPTTTTTTTSTVDTDSESLN